MLDATAPNEHPSSPRGALQGGYVTFPLHVVLMFLFVVVAAAVPARAATPASASSPIPQPTATAAAVSDPCTTTLAIVSRPSVTTSVCAVKPNHVEIETGYQNTIADGGKTVALYPQALFRIGTRIPNLEVSVAPPALDRAAGTTGSSDSAFGVKYEIGYTSKFVYGLNALVSVPTGLNGYSAGGTCYTANVNLSYALTPGVGLAGTMGYNSLSDGSRRFTSTIPSVVVSGALRSTTTLFGEVATFSHALGPATSTRVQYLAGIEQSIANRLQLDVEAGRSSTTATGKYRYVGFGASFLF